MYGNHTGYEHELHRERADKLHQQSKEHRLAQELARKDKPETNKLRISLINLGKQIETLGTRMQQAETNGNTSKQQRPAY